MTDEHVYKRMAELIRKRAKLLDKACPKCNSPLLGMPDGMMYCAKCDVRYVEEAEIKEKEQVIVPNSDVLTQLASNILLNLEILCQTLPKKPHLEDIRQFAEVAEKLVETLRMIRDLQA